MPPEQKRIIQPREAAQDPGGSWISVGVTFVLTVVPFAVVLGMVLKSRKPDYFMLLFAGVFALAGIAGLVYKLMSDPDWKKSAAAPLELDGAGPAIGEKWHATVRLPASAMGATTVRAELLCKKETGTGEDTTYELVWGKGSSFGIRWVYREGSAALLFDIPAGLSHSDKWTLKVTAGDVERNYDLEVRPASFGTATPAAAPALARTDELPSLPSDYSSVWVLVAANLVLIAGVVYWGWRAKDVVLLYFIEALVVGAFNVPAMLIAVPWQMGWMTRQGIAPSGLGLFLSKVFQAVVFALHYSFCCYVIGELLSSLILFDGKVQGPNTLWPLLRATFRDPHALVAIGAMVASHGYSFLRNYVGRGEFRRADMKLLNTRPYRRLMVTSTFVLAGGFALFAFNSPLVFVAVFVVIKIVLDVYYHLAERKTLAAAK